MRKALFLVPVAAFGLASCQDITFKESDYLRKINPENTTPAGTEPAAPASGDDLTVTGILLNTVEASLSLDGGGGGIIQRLTATVLPGNAADTRVIWVSLNSAVAAVEAADPDGLTGVVTARSAGTALIAAVTRDGGKTATCAVTVTAGGGEGGLPGGGDGGGGGAAAYILHLPVADPAGGEAAGFATVTPPITLSLHIGAPSGTEIWYTTDGSAPRAEPPSIRYTGAGGSGPFTMRLSGAPMTATLKAITHKNGYTDSPVLTAVYTSATASPSWTEPAAPPLFDGVDISYYVIDGICYGGLSGGAGTGKFIIYGNYGKMAYSQDGERWTAVENSRFGSSFICGVCYGGPSGGAGAEKFVAVGEGGIIAYSQDGEQWTAVGNSRFGGSFINGVCYGGPSGGAGAGKFVAAGSGGKMAYSQDGEQWTAVGNSQFGSLSIFDVCYGAAAGGAGAGKFVAVGEGGKMAYSEDGITWQAVGDSRFEGSDIFGVCYGAVAGGGAGGAAGKFVAVGAGGKMAYSADGITWSSVGNSQFGGSGIFGVCYGGVSAGGAGGAGAEKFVAVGEDGKIAYSEDGITWQAMSAVEAAVLNGVCYGTGGGGAGKFVAVGGGGKIVCASF